MFTEDPITEEKAKTKNEYNILGEAYVKSKSFPWRKVIEEYTIFNILNKNWKGLDILDIACGSGHYSMKYASEGAHYVQGVDISDKMIEIAKQGSVNTKNVEFLCADAANLNTDKKFDVVSAIYLISYAKNRDEIANFAKIIKKNLKSDGVFIGFNDHPDNPITQENFKKYSITKAPINGQGALKEGDGLIQKLYDESENYTGCFTNYWTPKAVVQEVFLQEGLNLKFVEPEIDPNALKGNEDYWQPLLDNLFVIAMSATHV